MNRTIASILMLSVVLSAGAASAQSDRSREIAVAGVDFNDQAQVGRLYQRLKHAARDVCAEPGRSTNAARAEQSACAAAAFDKAVASLDRPQLRLAHDGAPALVQMARR
jgi:UrcA family protein